MKPRYTSWDDVPLVCNIEETARVLGRSVRQIRRLLHLGMMSPRPMPRCGGKTSAFLWSKADLQTYLEGGYRKLDSLQRGRRVDFRARA